MDMLSYLQYNMEQMVSTFDIYLFTARSNKKNLQYAVKPILMKFLDANYNSYTLLNSDEIRDIAQSLFNLNEFSAVKASEEVFSDIGSFGIRPISLRHEDGSIEVLGKTYAQEAQEREAAQQAKLEKHTSTKVKPNKQPKQPKQSKNTSSVVPPVSSPPASGGYSDDDDLGIF